MVKQVDWQTTSKCHQPQELFHLKKVMCRYELRAVDTTLFSFIKHQAFVITLSRRWEAQTMKLFGILLKAEELPLSGPRQNLFIPCAILQPMLGGSNTFIITIDEDR